MTGGAGGDQRAAEGPVEEEQARLKTLWRSRALQHGARSVHSLRHRPEDYGEVTGLQSSILLPLLRSCLTGRERRGLDFGCGSGRFSGAIAEALGRKGRPSLLAYDICQELLDLAPPHPFVGYTSDFSLVEAEGAPRPFHLVWLCLVLGGLSDGLCASAGRALSDLLDDGGRLFLVEPIGDVRSSNPIWNMRTLGDYQAMFPDVRLRHLGAYFDCGNEVTILAVTKRPGLAAGLRVWTRYLHAEITLRLAQIAGLHRRPRLRSIELDRHRR